MTLTMAHQPEEDTRKQFPELCKQLNDFYGLDFPKEPVQVSPAAHYTCGGITATIEGDTGVPGLYAIGECANTGLHGANRLAGNSLLECVVMGQLLAKRLAAEELVVMESFAINFEARAGLPSNFTEKMKSIMEQTAGLSRDDATLKSGLATLWALADEPNEPATVVATMRGRLQLVLAQMLLTSALARKESRGGHFRTDYPETATEAQPTHI